ncbi:unnamed protein product [Allacma fusca]|uniref:Epsilon-sarcoglycan n=1 Tax=Allacma fusca TaxID=39272 RepID=A0A8J2K6G7_9HEXA|nr:unnamed protein product [Allacma fusca]
MLLLFALLFLCHNVVSSLETFQQKYIVNSSELRIIAVTPTHFNWNKTPGSVNEIEYSARISQAPDLPEWLNYAYEGYNSVGYIYGVPPKQAVTVNLDIVGWNHYQNYDVRLLRISMDVIKKDPLEFIIELKIDNLNVKDMCNPRRMDMLLDVLKDQLGWTQIDGSKVVPAYLASAVAVGENRVPLRPNDAEGIIIHLASDKDFSPELKKLQLEVSSLWKMRPCPRDMKRTSMERHFRRQNFLIDWCSFRLTTVEKWNGDSESNTEEDVQSEEDSKELLTDNEELSDDQKAAVPSKFNEHGVPEVFHFKEEIPERGYGLAALVACLAPGSIGGLVGFLLIALLWVDREDDAPIDEDALCFEAGYRLFVSMFRLNKLTRCTRANEDEKEWARPVENMIIVTRPDETDAFGDDDRNTLVQTPLPPQYGEMHPNGAPALTYAV